MVSGLLTYCATDIRARNEMLCLTDMWRAAGSDDSKRPVEWLRSTAAQEFIGYLADCIKVGNSHLVITERGGRDPSTWAHWQIGMAYAKYLSPEFHAWCNEVVRSHMELTRGAPASIDLLNNLFDQKLEPMRADIKRIDDNVIRLVTKGRKDATVETVRIHGKVVRYHYFNKCPCGECDTIIMDNEGFIDGVWHHHHQFNSWDNRPTAMIPLAIDCHKRIESDAIARTRFGLTAWVHFQTLLDRLPPTQPQLPFPKA